MSRSNHSIAENLKLLCSVYPSVAEVCRRIGINRQQFNKYLAGTVAPSRRNETRICGFFNITLSDLALAPVEFSHFHNQRTFPLLTAHERLADMSGPEVQNKLQKYCGYYQTYQKIPYAKECIAVGFGQIKRLGNHFFSKHIELLQGSIRSELSQKKSKMFGTVVFEGGLLYILDHKSGNNPSYSLTTLYPSRSPSVHLVTGMTLSVSGMFHGAPYSANIVYEKLPDNTRISNFVRKSGIYDADTPMVSNEIKHIIKNSIRPDQQVFSHSPI